MPLADVQRFPRTGQSHIDMKITLLELDDITHWWCHDVSQNYPEYTLQTHTHKPFSHRSYPTDIIRRRAFLLSVWTRIIAGVRAPAGLKRCGYPTSFPRYNGWSEWPPSFDCSRLATKQVSRNNRWINAFETFIDPEQRILAYSCTVLCVND